MDGNCVDRLRGSLLVRWLLALCALSLAQEALASETMYPVPAGAYDPVHDVIQPGVSEQDSFRLREKYPGTSVVSHYRAVFLQWRLCTGDDSEWTSYADTSGPSPQ